MSEDPFGIIELLFSIFALVGFFVIIKAIVEGMIKRYYKKYYENIKLMIAGKAPEKIKELKQTITIFVVVFLFWFMLIAWVVMR